MKTATSRNGTHISYDELGEGQPLVLVGGTFNTRTFGLNESLAPLLAERFTVVYDAAIVDHYQKGRPLPSDRWTSVTMPTLVAVGGKSPNWMRNAMWALADVLPNARHNTLDGQTHIVKPEALAPVLVEFFEEH
jgi:hypothetical protein